MHSRNNQWGGSFEMSDSSEVSSEYETTSRSSTAEWDRAAFLVNNGYFDERMQLWVLKRQEESLIRKKTKNVDFCCILWTGFLLVAFCLVVLSMIIGNLFPKHYSKPTTTTPPPDNYTLALNKALLFFNAQKSGRLPESNGIPWRANSRLKDGSDTDVKGRLVGGYFDAGDNAKFHFNMAYAMTMLSWSVLEYKQKYMAVNEYDHARELIKWGTDYLLLTFDSSAQVGGSLYASRTPDDHHCWQKPEDMEDPHATITINQGPDLAGEMAAALAAASIVFKDDFTYSKKLIKGAETVFAFARDSDNSTTGYFDEYMWGGAWLYYATGNTTYISLATDPSVAENSKAFDMIPNLSVLSWNNKLPAAMLLLTRFRMFLNPGYPYEDMLSMYHNVTGLTMCFYLQQFNVFNWTKGGLIQLNDGQSQSLQYVANAAFMASLFADYMEARGVPGWYCGSYFFPLSVLKAFAASQVDYIMGKNPMKMSYVVGYGNRFPRHVHHRGASIPNNNHKNYSCIKGWKWRDNPNPNPNNITGGMVGGPNCFDQFNDSRNNYNYTEPTLAGNAGLVAALISLTSTAVSRGIDVNTIFLAIPSFRP